MSEMSEPHRMTITLRLESIVSQMRWKTEGNAGFALPRYWNSSSATTRRSPSLVRRSKRTSQLSTDTWPSSSSPVNAATCFWKAARFCSSDSSVARKYSARLSRTNSVMSAVFPMRRWP